MQFLSLVNKQIIFLFRHHTCNKTIETVVFLVVSYNVFCDEITTLFQVLKGSSVMSRVDVLAGWELEDQGVINAWKDSMVLVKEVAGKDCFPCYLSKNGLPCV